MSTSKMKCKTCGNHAEPCKTNRKNLISSFNMQLRSKFDIYTNVPCFMRKVINSVLIDFMRVKTPENEFYQFDLDKLEHKTRIYGEQYNKFLEDYNMERLDIIALEFVPEKEYLLMYPQDQDGIPKEKDTEAVFVFEESAKAVVITKGVKPKPSEVDNINHAVMMRGLGQGAIFIHRVSDTDIKHNGLRIPKHLVSEIDVPRSGKSYLIFGQQQGSTEAKYRPTADGRIYFKSGWAEFVAGHNLAEGMLLLIMFHKMNDNNLQVSFDYVGN